MPDEERAPKQETAPKQEAPTTEEKKPSGTINVYQAGNAVPAPSGADDMLWTEEEWEARDPEQGYYRFDGDKQVY